MTHNKINKLKYIYTNIIKLEPNFINNRNNHIRKLSLSKLMKLTLNILQQIYSTKKLIKLKNN